MNNFDSILLIGFGGPEKSEDIRPFLETVVAGRNIPAARLDEVQHHYEMLGGKSPFNELTREQAKALELELENQNINLPIYLGMRNWHPFLKDTVKQMASDGRKKCVALILAMHQSRSSWEQYQGDLEKAFETSEVSLEIKYVTPAYKSAGFIEALTENTKRCIDQVPNAEQSTAKLFFTAHSVPLNDPFAKRYESQIQESSEAVMKNFPGINWELVYQSRSGRPTDPWLEPDICDAIETAAAENTKHIIIQPVGFICDHIEVLFDLDVEAKETCEKLKLGFYRAKTVGTHPAFIKALADAIQESLNDGV